METPLIWDAIALIMTSLQCVHQPVERWDISRYLSTSLLGHRCTSNHSKVCRKTYTQWIPIITTIKHMYISMHNYMMASSNGNIFRVTGPLCGEFTGPGEFPTQRPVTRSFDVLFDLPLNKRLSKQPWGWWFETPSWSLWRQRNEQRNTLKNNQNIHFFITLQVYNSINMMCINLCCISIQASIQSHIYLTALYKGNPPKCNYH